MGGGEGKGGSPGGVGVDESLKRGIVVDDDIDVFDESDVLWAIATRVQADRALLVVSGSLGAILDPSAGPDGVTAKLGIDATRRFGDAPAEKMVMTQGALGGAPPVVGRGGRGRKKAQLRGNGEPPPGPPAPT